jgi:DNA-binding response OmpR family regulator
MGQKILIIDDSMTVRKVIRSFLAAEGYDVVVTADAANVSDLMKHIKPDLVILDIMMPQMDGYTFLRLINKDDLLNMLPVLVMSSKKKDAVKDLFSFKNVCGYIEKPFKKEELVAIIKETLQKKIN